MSDRELPHVYKSVCVLCVDADVSCIMSKADSTQLFQCHAHCSGLHVPAWKDKELTFLNGTLGEKQDHVSPPKDRCFPLRPKAGLSPFSLTIPQTASSSWFKFVSPSATHITYCWRGVFTFSCIIFWNQIQKQESCNFFFFFLNIGL